MFSFWIFLLVLEFLHAIGLGQIFSFLSCLIFFLFSFPIQIKPADFNRGKLRNVGFLEAEKYGHFDCYVFHDVDLIPENDQNLYMCDNSLRQLSSAIDEWRYQ